MKPAPLAAVLLAACLLGGCSKSPPNPLLGTWNYDHDLTVASLKRDSPEGQSLDADTIERMVGSGARMEFSKDRAVFDIQASSGPRGSTPAMHFEYDSKVLASDPQSVTVAITERASGSSKTDVFHIEDPDVIWLEVQPTGGPVHSYRSYFRRQK